MALPIVAASHSPIASEKRLMIFSAGVGILGLAILRGTALILKIVGRVRGGSPYFDETKMPQNR